MGNLRKRNNPTEEVIPATSEITETAEVQAETIPTTVAETQINTETEVINDTTATLRHIALDQTLGIGEAVKAAKAEIGTTTEKKEKLRNRCIITMATTSVIV